MRLAVIPARGGSKRVPRKNIRQFCGQPMITWPIGTARESGLFDKILVSTDDFQIADLSRDFGADVPFMRPAALADDHTGTIEVVSHAVTWAKEQGWSLNAVCCIYPTAPMISVDDLSEGLRLIDEGSSDFIISATEYAAPIHRAFLDAGEGRIEMIFTEHFNTRSQDLPLVLHDAAQFYWGRPEAWLTADTLFGPSSRVVRVPRWRVQDIDTVEDWIRAEALFRALREAKL